MPKACHAHMTYKIMSVLEVEAREPVAERNRDEAKARLALLPQAGDRD